MAFTQEETSKIEQWFQSHQISLTADIGPEIRCKLCNGSMKPMNGLVGIIPYSQDDSRILDGKYLPVTCTYCGNTLFFSANVIGI